MLSSVFKIPDVNVSLKKKTESKCQSVVLYTTFDERNDDPGNMKAKLLVSV